MIGKGFRRADAAGDVQTKGFDAFELRLGDIMRGERATMGKSLLDVQRELKIKAAYIAAIENADPSAFDTPGFIAGYVRSYARYLTMDPDWAFDTFCRESGFVTAHGMSADASSVKIKTGDYAVGAFGKDIFSSSATPFIPAGEAILSGIEPRAVGSMLVLVALIGGLGYGGWTVLQEVQKVQFAPVEQTPVVVADLDPLAGASNAIETGDPLAAFDGPSREGLDRLYRPQALEVPVLVARDAPISTLTPGSIGALGVDLGVEVVMAEAVVPERATPAIQVVEPQVPELQLVAVRPAWVRVRAADGIVLFEGVMEPGQNFVVPATEEPATLRVGESGALYFAVNGTHYGPVGRKGVVTSNVTLTTESLRQSYAVADLTADNDLAEIVNVAEVIEGQ
ncbi:helix-turn-helix domain-containing protein [Yoonia sp.]|uniref:helix-turn-helix domain-containing protein n=1 Tax=Yoonia sp. TaxID=2212373 RepID=UPI0025CF358B|nr:helix-turn-helix domain-containing protein [Yoonia sp.]